MNSVSNHKIKVAFFPKLEKLQENPYWYIQQKTLLDKGIQIEEINPDYFDEKWLWKNRKRNQILHIHYIHQFYNSKRYINVFRFGLNLIFARILGFQTIFTLHNLEPTFYLHPIWLDKIGHFFTIMLSKKIIVHCEEAKILLFKKYGRKKNVFIVNHPNFFNYYQNQTTQKAARLDLNISEDAIVLLFFGGIRPNKGIENLIKEFKKINNPNLRLLIGGKPDRDIEYNKLIKNISQSDDRILLNLRFIPDNEIQIYFNAADIVVLPFSRILTSGSTILALSFGKPVIVPNMGCLKNLVTSDIGWLFDPANPQTIKDRLMEAIESNYKQMGENAFEKIKEFSHNKFGDQTINVYNNS